MKGWMYILECSDGSYYTGSTIKLMERFEEHQNGEGANHTKKRLPLKLVYYEEYPRIDLAFNREKQVQGWSRKKKEALIDGNSEMLPKLAIAYRDRERGFESFENLSHLSHQENENLSPRGNENPVPEALEGNESEIILYTDPKGHVRVEVHYDDETFWLSQKRMAELFGVEVQTVNYHLKEIFKSGELNQNPTIRKIRIVQTEGKREVSREVDFYHLDAVIAVGYRVNSYEATQFRIWATKTLREYIIKGFVMDDERLKQGAKFGKDYFDELLERVREIRASERRFYQKITDIYKACSIDYDAGSELTRKFYKTVQNKLHWAITGKTAAEIISVRAKLSNPKMGLTSWKNSPEGKVLKTDVSIAKNYLSEEEISEFNRIVSMYLDYAENQAARQRAMKMKDWVSKLDAFLQFNDYEVLKDGGAVSHAVAKELAEDAFEKFRITQDTAYESDFDREIKKLKPKQ